MMVDLFRISNLRYNTFEVPLVLSELALFNVARNMPGSGLLLLASSEHITKSNLEERPRRLTMLWTRRSKLVKAATCNAPDLRGF